MKKKIFLPVFGLICFNAFADVVDEIEFQGLDRVEVEAIQGDVDIKPHIQYTQVNIDNSLKALYKTGFFSDIQFIKKGNKLVVFCKERPMVEKVAFEGNDAVSKETLNSVINGRVGEGRLLSEAKIRDVLSDMQIAYRTLGYYSAYINPKYVRRKGNKVDVIFEIKEGDKTAVANIIFIGNNRFSDNELMDILATKKAENWRFWDSESQIFREDKVDVDIENLNSFYKKNGYPFFLVVSASAEMSFDKKSHYCTFVLEEGDRYSVGNVTLSSDVDNIDANDFKKFIEIKRGSIYNEELINSTKDRIRKEVSLRDHPFIDVDVDIKYDKQNKTADIAYTIVKRRKVFIERIEIVGNIRTLDRVIRREFSIHEGDAFNAYKIQDTVQCLKGTGYFDDVQISDAPGTTDDKRVLIVKVKEKDSTAQVKFGLNVSDSDGFGGFIGVSENNLFGTGQMVSTDIFWMQKYYGCKFMIFQPRFLDNNFGVGLNVGASSSNRKDYNQSITRTSYLAPFVRYNITERLGHKISFMASFDKRRWWDDATGKTYDHVPANVAKTPLMKDEYGKFTCMELASTLYYGDVDNPYDPRKGYTVSMTNSYAGIGGDVRYFKNEVSFSYYHPLTKKLTFITNADVGYINEIKSTRSGDRYALGGDGVSLRGFDSYGVGTKDLRGNSVGGNKFWTVSFMVKAPLSTREMGINGVAFLDFGSAWGTKYRKTDVRDSSAIRASTGVAIEWARSPIGVPLSFVFGFALKKKSFDDKQTFTLTGLM